MNIFNKRQQHNVKTYRPQERLSLGKISISVVTVSIMFLLGLFYILQVNEVSTMGYEINKNQRALVELADQQKQLEVEEAKLKALQGLDEEIEKLNYHPTETVGFTSPLRIETSENIAHR